MEILPIRVEIPAGCNVVIGQAHFIKTAEDIAEIMVCAVPGIKFGLAFCEASGPCLVRNEGSDEELIDLAGKTALAIGAGHTFILYIKNAYPINVLNQLKNCPEIARIFCATANPLQVLVVQTEQGRGIIGVIDGSSPKGIELPQDRQQRREQLRKFGYKF